MPVANKPRYLVTGKRWDTLDWSRSLSCKQTQIEIYKIPKSSGAIDLRPKQAFRSSKKQTKGELTGTFFWVTTHTESFPRTPMDVIPAAFTALNAYSTWKRRPSGENIVMWRSYPPPLPLLIFLLDLRFTKTLCSFCDLLKTGIEENFAFKTETCIADVFSIS